MFDLSAQIYPKIYSNDFESDIIDYIKSDKNLSMQADWTIHKNLTKKI